MPDLGPAVVQSGLVILAVLGFARVILHDFFTLRTEYLRKRRRLKPK
jgi:hypothetical protein